MRIKLFVPTKREEDIDAIGKRVSKLFNGCTIIPNCKGFWLNAKKELIEDEVTVIEAYTPKGSDITPSKAQQLIDLLYTVKRKLNQDTIAYCINNDIYFV